MPTVESLDRSMLQRILDQDDLSYQKRDGDALWVEFKYDPDIRGELSFMVDAAGEREEVFVMSCLHDHLFPPDQWAKAVMVCNRWNATHFVPKSNLNLRDEPEQEAALLVLEQVVDFEEGVHEEAVAYLIRDFIVRSFGFWKWAAGEQRLL